MIHLYCIVKYYTLNIISTFQLYLCWYNYYSFIVSRLFWATYHDVTESDKTYKIHPRGTLLRVAKQPPIAVLCPIVILIFYSTKDWMKIRVFFFFVCFSISLFFCPRMGYPRLASIWNFLFFPFFPYLTNLLYLLSKFNQTSLVIFHCCVFVFFINVKKCSWIIYC